MLTVPSLTSHGECLPGTAQCLWLEQVFFDGTALDQLPTGVAPGRAQFSLDSGRHVVLGQDPAGHLVEVATRRYWIVLRADDVTVEGFRMRHGAPDAQDGALRIEGRRAIVRNNVLSDTAAGIVRIQGNEAEVANNDIFRGGQLGMSISGQPLTDVVVRGNKIHDNNTEGFSYIWEAGGVKGGYHVFRFTFDANYVWGNEGVGLWCDGNGDHWTVTNNSIHHNALSGILYETCSHGTISGNRIWENGWSFTAWGWGGGVVLSASNQTEIANNTVGWNADGISVIAHRRVDQPGELSGNYVHDNVIAVSHQPGDTSDVVSLGWLTDNDPGMTAPSRGHRGERNLYWTDIPEPSYCRFQWSSCLETLGEFNSTPGEEAARYMTDSERNQRLTSAGIPTDPERH